MLIQNQTKIKFENQKIHPIKLPIGNTPDTVFERVKALQLCVEFWFSKVQN
jgi:hypothetical protein